MGILFDFPAVTNIFMNTGIVISNHRAYADMCRFHCAVCQEKCLLNA